jgi:Tol biopolymer transport system component
MPLRHPLRIALLAPVGAIMCIPFKNDPSDAGEASAPDASVPVAESSAPGGGPPCSPDAGFGDPRLVAGLADAATSIAAVRLSPDSLTAYFQAGGRPDSLGYDDIYTATRTDPASPFGHIAPLEGYEVNSPDDELYPTVSGDGLTLVFARSAPIDPVFLWSTTRSEPSTSFDVPVLLAPPVNAMSAIYDTTPFLRQDGQVLYFASNRVPERGIDIYRVGWAGSSADAAFDAPAPVDELNASSNELAPVVTPDDRTIYFASDRANGNGDFDIWTATRDSGAGFLAPTSVAELNSDSVDIPTFITGDGCTLYFSSARNGALLPYVATRGR